MMVHGTIPHILLYYAYHINIYICVCVCVYRVCVPPTHQPANMMCVYIFTIQPQCGGWVGV